MALTPTPPRVRHHLHQDAPLTVGLLLSGRAIVAIFLNLQIIAALTLITECCPKRIRGSVVTAISFGWNIGNLMIYALGLGLAWRALSVGEHPCMPKIC